MSEPGQTNRFHLQVQYGEPAVVTLRRSGTVVASQPVHLQAKLTLDRVPTGPIDVDVEAAGLVVHSIVGTHVTPSPQTATCVARLVSSMPGLSAKELLEETRAAVEEFARALETLTAAAVAERLASIEERLEAIQAAVGGPEG